MRQAGECTTPPRPLFGKETVSQLAYQAKCHAELVSASNKRGYETLNQVQGDKK